MTNPELEKILKSGVVPERDADYWEQFPKRVMAEARRRDSETPANTGSKIPAFYWSLRRIATLAAGPALACVLIWLALGIWHSRHPASLKDPQLAAIEKCFSEIRSLFPNQVEAVVFEESGARMELAKAANIPASQPLYLKISGPAGSMRVVTFSGQQVKVNGDVCEVLVDRQGEVLVVGEHWVWSSSKPAGKSGGYRIEARLLRET